MSPSPLLSQLLGKADAYRAAIDERRPLSPKQAQDLRAYFRVALTYASNAIEGNTLTLSETKVLLEDGITVRGKTFLEHAEAVGHGKAFDRMLELARQRPFVLSEAAVLELHRTFYAGIDLASAGVYRKEDVIITGTDFLSPVWQAVPGMMRRRIEDLNAAREGMHPILWAAIVHKELVDVHPFLDGNGRMARLLMNLALVNAGYGIAIIPPVLRQEYIDAIRAANGKGDAESAAFYGFIAECVLETQRDYCRLLRIPLIRT